MIVLQFSTQNTLLAAGIRWATWCDYSHVDFVLPNGDLYGAIPKGVRRHWPENYTRTKRFYVNAPIDVLNIALTQEGKDYDWRGIFGFGIRARLHDKDSWFCSELVAWAFEQAGYPLLRTEKYWRITPRDLLLSPLLKEFKQ